MEGRVTDVAFPHRWLQSCVTLDMGVCARVVYVLPFSSGLLLCAAAQHGFEQIADRYGDVDFHRDYT